MVNERFAFSALLALAAASSSAMAATPAPPQVDKLSIEVNARVQHDTNVSGVSIAESKNRLVRPDDTTFTPSVSLSVNLPVSRQTVFFRGYAGYLFHQNNKSLDSERLTFDGGITSRIGRCNVTADANYQRGLSRFEDIVLGPTLTNILEVERLSLDGKCTGSTGIGVNAKISRDWANNDQALLRPQDYQATAYSTGLTYAKPRLGALNLFVNHQRTEYINRVVISGATDGYDLDAFGVSYERNLGARISGSVSVGSSKVKSLAPTTPSSPKITFEGLTYSADLNYNPSRRMGANFSFDRQVQPSQRAGNSFDVTTSYRLSGRYDLGNRFTVNLGAEQREVESQGLKVFASNLTNSRVKTVFGSVAYRQSRRLSLTLDAALDKRETNDVRFDYDNTRVGLTAGVRY